MGILSVWILLSITNILYDLSTKTLYKDINDLYKETDFWFSKEFLIFIYLIISLVFSPIFFFLETIPNILVDVINIPRFIRYKRILKKRKQRNI